MPRHPTTLSARGADAPVDPRCEVGVCSTRPSLTAETAEVGVDTLKLVWETTDYGDRLFELDEAPGWKLGSIAALGLTWAEGHPAGRGELASAETVAASAGHLRSLVDERFEVRKDRGVSRSDQTVTTRFHREGEAQAFFAGMSAVQLPRTETTRRGHPVHSIGWTATNGRRLLARCYDKGLERGGEAFKFARLEDQRRYGSGRRPPIEVVADGKYLRDRFERRFGPVRKAVNGLKAASFPVIAQALADEVRYGYRDWRDAERLAGSLVLLTGGAREAYSRPTYYRRKAELREAGYVVVDDLAEAVEVNLGDVVDQALEVEWA